jgi:hypothetical protein
VARDWRDVLDHAAEIVQSYGTRVTLRQLFYRLVADGTLRNTRSEYGQLSAKTAQARRDGWFPSLMDRTRDIERLYPLFQSTDEALDWVKSRYRRDRTEGQEWSIYLAVEKAGIVNQLNEWFGYPLGIPILPLQGYSSQSFVDQVAADAKNDIRNDDGEDDIHYANLDEDGRPRPTVLIYAGDFDPSGEDIDRDFVHRSDCWDEVIRNALLPDQIEQYDLPPAMGKATDSRASQFIAKHGRLVQVELDALPPDTLRELYADAIAGFWNQEAHDAVMELEREERESLGS